jgi:hypothetical protein
MPLAFTDAQIRTLARAVAPITYADREAFADALARALAGYTTVRNPCPIAEPISGMTPLRRLATVTNAQLGRVLAETQLLGGLPGRGSPTSELQAESWQVRLLPSGSVRVGFSQNPVSLL